ncbi:MAG: amine oxidoreductase [Rhodospirillaceae bacterium]|nr:amine oxidoreductase [Rhodospirillaceae bacterium]HAA92903.1 amine oxidoreductase [Rhodospirillaceae bacterium]
MTRKIAIIGAGLAGLTLAHRLRGSAEIAVFDKSWRPGGRLSTRQKAGFQFDHGAQYFTIRSDEFRDFLQPALTEGAVRPWDARVVTLEAGQHPVEANRDEPIYVGAPSMNTLPAFLAKEISVSCEIEIDDCRREPEGWLLSDRAGITHGPFDWVVSTAPAPQSRLLLGEDFAAKAGFDAVRMRGCFSLMLGFESSLGIAWQGAFVKNSPIGWLALDSSKPGRDNATSLLVQAAGAWADEHLEDTPEQIESHLIEELRTLVGIDGGTARHHALHRWRYAGTAEPAGENFLIDQENQLAACGDWCIKGRVEAAFVSASKLGQLLLDRL